MRFDYDLLIIGGGINGCGIARDAAGRGFSVALVEMRDLGWATSSASTKLFHGGLRYLEYFEFRLVREALLEREVLLRAMPHISWPMRFVIPYHHSMRFDLTTPASKLITALLPWMKGRRPPWLIRLGLFLYDSLGGRKILPGAKSLNLKTAPEGQELKTRFEHAYEYSDCWIEDSRLVVLNARDAEQRGASIKTGTKVVSASVEDGIWSVVTQDPASGQRSVVTAKMVINAAGPWVDGVLRGVLGNNQESRVRLVRGSHLVTRRLFDHDKCFLFQGDDGRIIFAIPYETDFTLIGTTDVDHEGDPVKPECTPGERDYLLNFINRYVKQPVGVEDIVWSFSGTRPLYDDGADSASAATRDYVLQPDQSRGAPALNIFGGKITTYRRLAESAMRHVERALGKRSGPWTAKAALPGGDFEVDRIEELILSLRESYPFLDARWAKRLIRAYGTEAKLVLGGAKSVDGLGQCFGAGLYEVEVRWLIDKEYARNAEDVVWRRSKLGLRMSAQQVSALETWMQATVPPRFTGPLGGAGPEQPGSGMNKGGEQ